MENQIFNSGTEYEELESLLAPEIDKRVEALVTKVNIVIKKSDGILKKSHNAEIRKTSSR